MENYDAGVTILSPEAQRIAILYEQANAHDQVTVCHVLSRYALDTETAAEFNSIVLTPPKPPAPMLYAYLREYITRYKSVQIRDKTREMYDTAYKNITGQKKRRPHKDDPAPPADFPRLEDKPMDKITGEELQDFINTLAASLSRSSIDKVSLLLAQAYRQAIKDGKLYANPAVGLKLPMKLPKKVKALTSEQQARVEAAAGEYAHGDLVIFLLRTGLRLQEALRLTWRDIDLMNGECTVGNAKTQAGLRTIYLTKTALTILRKRQKNNPDKRPNAPVFQNKNGERITNNVYRLCQTIGKRANVSHFHPHMCRHCFATRLLEKNASMKAVSELLGHRRVQITFDTYSHVLSRLKKETINLLN